MRMNWSLKHLRCRKFVIMKERIQILVAIDAENDEPIRKWNRDVLSVPAVGEMVLVAEGDKLRKVVSVMHDYSGSKPDEIIVVLEK